MVRTQRLDTSGSNQLQRLDYYLHILRTLSRHQQSDLTTVTCFSHGVRREHPLSLLQRENDATLLAGMSPRKKFRSLHALGDAVSFFTPPPDEARSTKDGGEVGLNPVASNHVVSAGSSS